MLYFRIPDSFRDLWTREKRLKWKDVKKTLICNLHFEAKCFKGKRLNLHLAVPKSEDIVVDHTYSAPSTSIEDASQTDVLKNHQDTMLELEEARKQISCLKSTNQSLECANKTLIRTNNYLKSTNNYLKSANETLNSTNKSLREENESLKSSNVGLQQENQALKVTNDSMNTVNLEIRGKNLKLSQSCYYLKRKRLDEQSKMAELSSTLQDIQSKFALSSSMMELLSECSSEVPKHMFESTTKRMANTHDPAYHPALKKFALSLHLCSSKAYRYV